MKYLKYIILLVILIIILITTILFIMSRDTYIKTDEVEETNLKVDINTKVSVVENRSNYYAVKKIVENYYYDLTQFNMKEENIIGIDKEDKNSLSNVLETERLAYKNKVYNYLDKGYIQKNNIKVDNIQSKLGTYNDVIVFIENMYYVDANEQVKVYFVDGNVIEKTTLKKSKFSMMISTDTQNSTFEIYPNDYEYKVELGKELIINKDKINDTKYNKYNYAIVNDETYSKDMFQDYKDRLIYDIESSYNKLDEEYRKAKFSNIEEYKNYVKDKKLVSANLNNYQVTNTQILCVDRNNKSYIFKVTTPMKYSLILDTYTIDIQEFTTKYSETNDKGKVILNINKFMLALNDKDYKYAYSILASSFKKNNFPTLESFEKYAKTNFFEQNKFDYIEFGDESGTYYTYKVNITDGTGKNNKLITKTFIMKLDEGTKFETSFNV